MAKKKNQKTVDPEAQKLEGIKDELDALDQEIAGLEAQKRAEDRAALAAPLSEQQAEALNLYEPFAASVIELKTVWDEVNLILKESEQIREELEEARQAGRLAPEFAPPELERLRVPDCLGTVLPDETFLRKVDILEGSGPYIRVDGQALVLNQIRNDKISGITDAEQRAMVK